MMNSRNLFDHLESYAQENFATEIFAYILQTDDNVKERFVDLLLSGKPKKLRAAFYECEIDTQPSYDVGRPDLRITPKGGAYRPIFVEVKIRAQEGRNQIEKYQKHGYVALLAPQLLRSHMGENFLGHFFWYQVYSLINSAKSKNEIHRQFLKYLEARNMSPSKPISPKDLRRAKDAVTVIRKLQEVVSGVREKVEPEWVGLFGPNTGAKQVSDGIGTGCLPFWWYRTKGWRKRGIGGFYLVFGVEVHEQAPEFFLGIGSSQKKFANTFESKSEKKFQKLRKQGWEKDTASEWDWCYAKFFRLGEGDIEKIANKQARSVMSATGDLQRLGIIKSMQEQIEYPRS